MLKVLQLRSIVVGTAAVLTAAALGACGDSSDDDATKAATKTTTAAKAAAPAAKPAASGSRESTDLGQNVPADVQAWSDAGTVRLAAVRFGTPGKLVVTPKGNVTDSDPKSWDHWYPKGTKVTIEAKDTRTARFAEWAGACAGKTRTCQVELTEYKRVIGGFNLDKKGAKGLPKNDPALKPGSGS